MVIYKFSGAQATGSAEGAHLSLFEHDEEVLVALRPSLCVVRPKPGDEAPRPRRPGPQRRTCHRAVVLLDQFCVGVCDLGRANAPPSVVRCVTPPTRAASVCRSSATLGFARRSLSGTWRGRSGGVLSASADVGSARCCGMAGVSMQSLPTATPLTVHYSWLREPPIVRAVLRINLCKVVERRRLPLVRRLVVGRSVLRDPIASLRRLAVYPRNLARVLWRPVRTRSGALAPPQHTVARTE